MIYMTEIREQFDPKIREEVAKKKKKKSYQVAVIPIGAIEQHGPHLPVSVDSDIVTEVARQVSEKNRYMLLPTIDYGVSFEHAPFFNLSVRESTLRSILVDLCMSLLSNGIRTVFIINGHHGNLRAVKNLDAKLKDMSNGKLRVSVLSYWHFMTREFDHAGFAETSLMLAISKNVKMGLAERGLTTDGMSEREIARVGKIANKSFISATKNGVWGDPRGATKRDGEILLSQIVQKIRRECRKRVPK